MQTFSDLRNCWLKLEISLFGSELHKDYLFSEIASSLGLYLLRQERHCDSFEGAGSCFDVRAELVPCEMAVEAAGLVLYPHSSRPEAGLGRRGSISALAVNSFLESALSPISLCLPYLRARGEPGLGLSASELSVLGSCSCSLQSCECTQWAVCADV